MIELHVQVVEAAHIEIKAGFTYNTVVPDLIAMNISFKFIKKYKLWQSNNNDSKNGKTTLIKGIIIIISIA